MKSLIWHRLGTLLLVGAVLCGVVALALPSLRHRLAIRSALSADSLDDGDVFGEPGRSLTVEEAERLWDTGRLPHRRSVLTAWMERRGTNSSLDEQSALFAGRLIRESAVDPDLEIRTRMLGGLKSLDESDERSAVAIQLVDIDPELRRLGLATLRRLGGVGQIPWVLPLLDDPDPTVVLAADATLRKWTGRDSGLRLSQVLPASDSLSTAPVSIEQGEEFRRAIQEWKTALAGAKSESPLPVLHGALTGPAGRPVANFVLEDVHGQPVGLDAFKGKRVLLNFWATWCPACLVELPILCELQRRHSDDLVVLGISLDSPDGLNETEGSLTPEALRELRKLVGTVAARHRLNYRVLLDPRHEVGRRFNGGELPTQVLLDRDGRIRRRFVGGRGLEVWEALLAEAGRPMGTAPSATTMSPAVFGESAEQVGSAARH
jgi:thiol-disulfide isomerase/thioredoxin